ncbi:vesicle transport protein GOT1-like isoform X2 [Hordeum vulgare subsp. vulgare]|uniref:vesicle transport protein GOT1-like isoform X2 n=2 Tax=Hordeum vulgare subsp. vulgare TaxID=112509 RepID=UPI001D1A3CB4|nr:vesicle transport protein GOT1-like isoform X2 [Hordeum vulgare subsp. vulgare]
MIIKFKLQKEIGIGLVGFGILFSFLGVILFFDRGLLALGNIFFLTGVGLLLGWQSMWQLFTKKANIKGSVPFFLGLFLLFVRWPVAGIILELYGTFVLFSGYGAPIQAFLYQIPIIGWILQYPFQFSSYFCSCLVSGVSVLDNLWWQKFMIIHGEIAYWLMLNCQ